MRKSVSECEVLWRKEKLELVDVKTSIQSLHSQVAVLDNMQRKKSFLIRNFPENTNSVGVNTISSCRDAVMCIAKALKLDISTLNIKDAFRLGKVREDRKPRLILVKACERSAKLFLSNARMLKAAVNPLNRVFIQENLPPEIHVRLSDMRKRAYDHCKNFPGEQAFVRNKRLFINGVVVDEIKQSF